jgi:outer membrane phospholipase A
LRRLLAAIAALYALHGAAASPPEWIIASRDSLVPAGGRIELVVVSLGGQALPEELTTRLKSGLDERIVTLQATGPARGLQRSYSGTVPPGMAGTLELELVGRASSVLTITVEPRRDAVGALTGRHDQYEPPLSENDPMYFVVGARDGWSARFQLSFKYRLFDRGSGYGRSQPLLSALYFGYTQNSLWELDSESRAFRDTSYMPSFFWKWERTVDGGWLDAARLGLEHESNGTAGERSRSINIFYVRPEWHWRLREQHRLEFTPKIYGYLDRSDNPDIYQYRGYVDWRLRYDAAGEWIATSVTRIGTSGKGSFLLDLSKRARDIRFGPVGGYWHFQFFTGYGESILDYDVRRKSQLRIGFAIVP